MVTTTSSINGGGGGILYPAQGNNFKEDRGKNPFKPKKKDISKSKKK